MSQSELYVALDVSSTEALRLGERLTGVVDGLKVGLSLYTEAGPGLVRELRAHGHRVFLDLKYHDIPHQVGLAVAKACDLGVSLITIHTCGGREMMESAARASEGYDAKVVGVTVLTSLDRDALGEVSVRGPLEAVVDGRARLAHEAGLDGVVASAQELRLLRDAYPRPFCIVTPGIRPAGGAHGDQARVTTPKEAVARGSDVLVMGRPITQADDPVMAAQALMREIRGE